MGFWNFGLAANEAYPQGLGVVPEWPQDAEALDFLVDVLLIGFGVGLNIIATNAPPKRP